MNQARSVAIEISDKILPASGEVHDLAIKQVNANLVVHSKSSDRQNPEKKAGEQSLLAGKWPGLLERVQGAARYIREVEDRAQEQEFHVQELLEKVRADMMAARAQVQAAEQQTRDVQARATKLIKAAEERACFAEERAAAAEQMLLRISETIEAEFVVQPAGHSTKIPATGHPTYAIRAAS